MSEEGKKPVGNDLFRQVLVLPLMTACRMMRNVETERMSEKAYQKRRNKRKLQRAARRVRRKNHAS